MKYAEIIQREKVNKNTINLYPMGGFYSAFDLSAYLLQVHLWPEINPMYKYVGKNQETVRVGFPISSLQERVLKPAAAKNIPCRQVLEKDLPLITATQTRTDPLQSVTPRQERFVSPPALPPEKPSPVVPVIILGPINYELDAYERWRQNFFNDYQRVNARLHPIYDNMPVYHQIYTLLNDLVALLKHLPRDVRDTFGRAFVDLTLKTNLVFYRSYIDNNHQLDHDSIRQISEQLDLIALLVRICHDQDYVRLDYVSQVAEKVASARRQLTQIDKKYAACLS